MSKHGVLVTEVLNRKAKGISNAEIAKQLGVPEKYVTSVLKKNKEDK